MVFLPQIKSQLPAFMFVNTIDLNNNLKNEYLGLGKDKCISAFIMMWTVSLIKGENCERTHCDQLDNIQHRQWHAIVNERHF